MRVHAPADSARARTAGPDDPARPLDQRPLAGGDRRRRFQNVSAQLPTGVCVVATADAAGLCGLTASSVCSLSLDPPLLLVCVDNRSLTLARLLARGVFTVNVLRAEHSPMASRFATAGGGSGKFDDVGYRLVHGAPVLDEALAWFRCTVHSVHPGGDHTITVGAVTDLHRDYGDPLVRHARRYRALS